MTRMTMKVNQYKMHNQEVNNNPHQRTRRKLRKMRKNKNKKSDFMIEWLLLILSNRQSYIQLLILFNNILYCFTSLFITGKHLAVSFLHLEIYFHYLSLVIFPKLLFIHLHALFTIFCYTCHLFLIILKLLSQKIVFIFVHYAVTITVIRITIYLRIYDSLCLFIHICKDGFDYLLIS